MAVRMIAAEAPAVPVEMRRCWHCLQVGLAERNDRPWCAKCAIYLQLDDATGEWVSFAENVARQRQHELAAYLQHATQVIEDALPLVLAGLCDGWSARSDTSRAAISVTPATSLEPTASLVVDSRGRGWRVTIHDRPRRMSYPLFADGGTRAATFAAVGDALAAAAKVVPIDSTRSPRISLERPSDTLICATQPDDSFFHPHAVSRTNR